MFPGICHCIGPPGAEPPGSEQKGAAHPDTSPKGQGSPKGQDGPLGLSHEPGHSWSGDDAILNSELVVTKWIAS